MSVVERERVVTEVTRRDVLHRAADLLEEFGWCQGHFAKTVDGRAVSAHSHDAVLFCAVGALAKAARDLSAAAGETNFGLDTDLSAWNDERGRTKAEVVSRLRAAAEATDA